MNLVPNVPTETLQSWPRVNRRIKSFFSLNIFYLFYRSFKPWENQNADCNYIHTLSFLSHRELNGGQKTKKTTSRSYSTPSYYGCGLTPPGCNAHFRKQNNYYCKEKNKKKNKMKKISANPRYHSILYYVSTTLLRNAGKFFSPIFGNFIFASWYQRLGLFFPNPKIFGFSSILSLPIKCHLAMSEKR